MATDRDRAAQACRLLELDPARVRSIGFELEAYGVAVYRVELIADDETSRKILELLLD